MSGRGLLFLSGLWLMSAPFGYAITELGTRIEVSNVETSSTLDRVSGLVETTAEVRLFNLGDRVVEAPIHVVVRFSGEGATVMNASGGPGTLPYDAYYLDLSEQLDAGFPSQETISFTMRYSRPPAAGISYALQIYGVVNADPVAVLSGPDVEVVGSALAFSASGSFDPDGGELVYNWEFGDGTTSSEVAPQHFYALPGVYTVRLRVTDPKGATDQSTLAVRILPEGEFALARVRTLDGSGQPLAGVRVEETGGEAPVAGFSDASGLFVGSATAGSRLWRFFKAGYLEVWREVEYRERSVVLVASPWLMKAPGRTVEVSPLSGVTLGGPDDPAQVAFPAGAFGQMGPAGLTALGGQTLPLPLPRGWSPLSAFHFSTPGEILEPGAVTWQPPRVPLADETLAVLRFDPSVPQWQVMAVTPGGSLPATEVLTPGVWALIVADKDATAPPAPVVGEALTGGDTGPGADFAAEGAFDPPLRVASLDPAAVTTTGRVFFEADAAIASGRLFRAEVSERYALVDGGNLRTPDYDTTFFAYRDQAERSPDRLRAEFSFRPSLLLSSSELAEARLFATILDAEVFAGAILDAQGGVLATDFVTLAVPPGAFERRIVGELRDIDAGGFSSLLNGLSAARAFQLIAPEALAPIPVVISSVSPNTDYVLARLISAGGRQGLEPVLRMRSDASGTARSTEPESGPRLPGLTGGGRFVLVEVESRPGLVTGAAHALDGAAVAGLVAGIVGQPWQTLTRSGGIFATVAPVGEGTAEAADPADANRGIADFELFSDDDVAVVEIQILPTGPRVVATLPEDGAVRVRAVTPIVVHFSEPIDPASFGPEALTVTNPLGVVVAGTLGLNQAHTTATFLPTNPLEHAATFTIELAPTIRDLQGLEIEGPLTFSFSVLPFFERALGAQLVIYEPGAQGIPAGILSLLVGYIPGEQSSHVIAHGSPGTADPEVPVILVNQSTGATATVLSRPDGSFANFIDADEEDFIEAVFVNANDTVVVVPSTRQLFDDGRVGLYKYGGILEAESDGGTMQVFIEPEAIRERAVFQIEAFSLDKLAESTGGVMPEGDAVALPGVRIAVEGEVPAGKAEVAIPIDPQQLGLDPSLAPEDAAIVLTIPIEVGGEIVYVVVDRMRYEDGRIFTNTCPFPGVFSASTTDSAILVGANFLSPLAGIATGFAQMAIPVILSKRAGGVVVNGRALQVTNKEFTVIEAAHALELALLPFQFVGGRFFGAGLDTISTSGSIFEELRSNGALPVQGALIALRPTNENFDGIIRPGLVTALSDQSGCFSMMVPSGIGGKLVGTHPRLGRANDVPINVAAVVDSGTKGFVARNIFFTPSDDELFSNLRPRLVVSHNPLDPAVGVPVEVRVDVFSAAPGTPNVLLDRKKSVVSAVSPGQEIAEDLGDLDIVESEVERIAEGHVRRVFTITSDVAMHAGLLFRSGWTLPRSGVSSDGRSLFGEAAHPISFGFARPPITNPLLQSDPLDVTAPYVVSVFPREGNYLYPGQEVQVRFSEPIDRAVLNTPGAVVVSGRQATPAMKLSEDQQVLTLHPRVPNPGVELGITLGMGIRDLAGNAMKSSRTLVFRAGRLGVSSLPDVVSGGGSVVDGSLAYVLERGGQKGVKVFDLSDPSSPALAHHIPVLPGPSALDFPRDAVLVRNWSHFTGFEGEEFSGVSERPLLCVTGGLLGITDDISRLAAELGNVRQQGQYLTIFDVSDPRNPVLVVNVQITVRPSVITKVRWQAPFLVYQENSADTHFVSIVDLQALLVGFATPAEDRLRVFGPGRVGVDINGDGDYTDIGADIPPKPKVRDQDQFMGFLLGYDVTPFPAQRIEDFDFDGLDTLAVIRNRNGVNTALALEHARPEFRLLVANRTELPPQAGVVQFGNTARVRRLALAPNVRIDDGTLRNLAFVTLSPDADGKAKVVVIDWSDVLSPGIVLEIEVPAELEIGQPQSPHFGSDGMVRVATTTGQILIDPSRVFMDAAGDPLHPAVVGVIPAGGSPNFSIGMNDAGLRVVALGGRAEAVQGPPRLEFVQMATLAEVVDPTQVRVSPPDDLDAVIKAIRPVRALRPARFRPLAGVPSTLSPPAPTVHYHVLVYAPGGGGITLPLVLESVNEAGTPLNSKGIDYPPVRAAQSAATLNPGGPLVAGVDAPVSSLTAYRLSDDPAKPEFNMYLSDPIALIREKISPSELQVLRDERRRVLLWSEAGLRVGIDRGASGVLASFETDFDVLRGEYVPRVATMVSTLPGGYIPGGTPPPVGGGLSVPGTFGTIDAGSGEFRHTTADLELPGRTMPIVFERTATNHALVHSGFGRGWDFFYNQRAIDLDPVKVPAGDSIPVTERGGGGKDVVAKSEDIIFSDGEGHSIVFARKGRDAPPGVANDPLLAELGWQTAGGDFYLPAENQKGVFDLMYRYASGEMARLTPDGTLFRYRDDGRLAKIEHRYPDNFHELEYNADGQLVRILDRSVTSGRDLRLGYFRKSGDVLLDPAVDKIANNDKHVGRICALVDFADRRVNFEYDTAGMLVQRLGVEVAGANGGFAGRPQTTYQIHPQTRAYVGVIAGSGTHGGGGDNNAGTPLAVAATTTNDRGEPVANATVGAAGRVGITVPPNRSAASVSAGATVASHADGSSTAMSFDANGYPAGITMSGQGAGAATYQTIHNDRGLPERIIYPEGNSVVYEYEPDSAPFRARSNVIKTTRDPGPRGGETLVSESAYDHRHNLPSGAQKDFNGNTINITLRVDGRDVLSTQYPKAGTHEITRNDFGQTVAETTVEGITSGIEYDSGTGYPSSMTVGSLTTDFGYNSSIAAKLGVASSITPPGGAAISQEHDARFQRTRLTRGGSEERYGYDENGNLIFASKALGDGAPFVEQREYSQINFLRKVTLIGVETEGGGGELVTSFTPDEVFRIKTMTLPGGEARSFDYDHLGQITKLQIGSYSEEYGRDLHGNLTEFKKGGDVVQEWVYNGHDRPVTLRHKTGEGGDETTTLTYFGTGETRTRTVSGTVGGVVSETVVADVDELGRPLSVEAKGNQANALITTSYNTNGGRTVTASGPVDTFTSTHDAAGRLVSQSSSLRSVTLTPDPNGNVTRVESTEDSQTYTVNMAYNDLDHLTRTSDPLGTILESANLRHDGLPLRVTDGRGNNISKTYSRLGELLQIEKPEQLRFSYSFTANRQPAAVRDRGNSGNTTAYADGTLRPTSTTWRDGSSTSFNAPDGRNLPTSISIPGGSMTATYDLQGRSLSLATTFTGGGYRVQNAQYDALSRLRSANYGSSGQHSLTHSYDKLGPRTGSTYNEPGGPFTIGTTIRADGARLTLGYPSGVTVTETRHASGRLSKVAVAGATLWEATAFAGADQPAIVLRGAGITETNVYDARRRLLARRFTRAGGVVLEDMRFQYDGTDNLTARQTLSGGGRADLFTYDAANRLTRAEYGVRPSFQGVNRGNPAGLSGGAGFAAGWMARTYQYDSGGFDLLQAGVLANPDALPAQTAASSALAVPHFAASLGSHDSFLFPVLVDGFSRGAPDALGSTARARLLVRPVSGAPVLVAADLAYNAHTNLLSVQRSDGVLIENQYRPDKLLHHRKVTGGPAPGERALVWHDGRLLEEYDLSSGKTLVARYYYATSDAPIAADLRQSDNSLLRVHYLQDQVMSVVAVANEAGEVIERARYGAWGQPLITARDQAAPRVAEVRREGDDLLVVMSEPVLPPLGAPAGSELVPDNSNSPAQAFRLVTGSGEQTPQVVLEENAPGLPFGSVFRVTPATTLSGSVTLRVLPGTLVDAWSNPVAAEDLNFVFGLGPVLASGGVESGATAPVAVPRSAIGNPWLWQGQWFDYDAGLVYMRARHYDPSTGLFLQRDPAQYEDSVNLYAGLRHNPVTLRDPTGMRTPSPGTPRAKAARTVDAAQNSASFARRQGLGNIEHQAITNILNRRLDKGDEIRLSIRGFGKKAASRRKLAEQGIQAKPSVISDKTGPDAAVRFTDTATGKRRVIASDLDALHLEINGRMASHSESMKLFGEINREVIRLKHQFGKPAWPPFQHGAQTGMVHLYSPTHSKKFTGAVYKLEGVKGGTVGAGQLKHGNKYIDDGFMTKVGHPGDSFTFKSSKNGGIEAYPTPRSQTTLDIQTAERILMKHQADHGLQPVGFGESWHIFKE